MVLYGTVLICSDSRSKQVSIFLFFIVALVLINKSKTYECLSLLPLNALIFEGKVAATTKAAGLHKKASRSSTNRCCTSYAGGIFGGLVFCCFG